MTTTFDNEGDPIDDGQFEGSINKEVISQYLDQGRKAVDAIDKTVGIGPAALAVGVALTAFGGYKLVTNSIRNSKNQQNG